MQCTLDTPLAITLDARTGTKLIVKYAHLDFIGRTVQIEFDITDSNGVILYSDRRTSGTAATQTWLTNNEQTIYTAVLNKLGLTGTVA